MGKVRVYKGFKPYFHQKAVIDELVEKKGTGKIVVCKSSRQKGKSYMIANLLLYYAINYAKTNNYCLSPSLKQAKNIFKTIIDAISGTDIILRKNATELTIVLINGSTINFKSAEQRDSLRGFTADFLAVDECAFIDDDIFYMILPWCDAKKAPILMVSTPYLKSGFFFKYYNLGLGDDENIKTIDWSDERFRESIERILPAYKLEEYRKVLPKNVFLTEYLGEWLDDEGQVFTNVTNCIEDHQITNTDRLYVGIDWSNQVDSDYTVVSVFNQDSEQVYLKYFNRITPIKQVELIVAELEPYYRQIELINCETNSLGTPYTELLKEKSQLLASKVEGFTTTNKSKNDMVTNMQVALEQNNITLLDDERLKREFGYFTANYNPKTKTVSYSAPNGLHDDIVMATLIAYIGLKENNKYGSYSFR